MLAALLSTAFLSIACAEVLDGSAASGPGTVGVAAGRARQGSRLERLIQAQANGQGLLPSGDDEDALELPAWFKVLLRKNLPGLPKTGKPQYPREALEVLHWLQAHPNAPEPEQVREVKRLEQYVPKLVADNQRRARYPRDWERPIPPGTALDRLRRQLEGRLELLPEGDLEDQSPLPVWFRVYLRQKFPELARSGPYQYPRTANRILQRLLDHPSSLEPAQ